MPQHIAHWIDGKERAHHGARTSAVHDPATGQALAEVELADTATVGEAVRAAEVASDAWRRTSLSHRTHIMFRFRQIVHERAEELAAIITAEHGKVLSDALGEVTRGLKVVEFACGMPHLLKGGFSEGVSSGVDVHSIRQPVGVSAIISPFNSPVMVPMWVFPVAIAAGNAVILKPSERDPSAAIWLAQRFHEAGLPPGVFNVVNGGKIAVDVLLEHEGVSSISFVGSTPVAKYVYEKGTSNGKRVQALGGAKNHMLMLPDANVELAADAAVNAGFGSAGERCMTISAIVAVEPIADELVKHIVERIGRLKTGDGRRNCDMGPLISREHQSKVVSYLESGIEAGAQLVVDGRDIDDVDGGPNGYWLKPTLFDHVSPNMAIYSNEICGPIYSILRVSSYDDGLRLINHNPYGNGAAIFTNDGGAARRFQYDVEIGMVGINVPIPVPVAYYSFGVWKSSLRAIPLSAAVEHLSRSAHRPSPCGERPHTAGSSGSARVEGATMCCTEGDSPFIAFRRYPRARNRGRPLLHARQSGDFALARAQPWWPQPRVPRAHMIRVTTGRPSSSVGNHCTMTALLGQCGTWIAQNSAE